jgi:hypothetical protein
METMAEKMRWNMSWHLGEFHNTIGAGVAFAQGKSVADGNGARAEVKLFT